MGYFGGPNKALTNPCFKRPRLVSFEKEKKNGKEKEKRRGRERGDQAKIKAKKVWNLDFWYENQP